MITLILGKKGSGKTKKLMDLCNTAVEQSKGNVVFIEKDNTLTYDLSHKARLVAAEDYAIRCYGCLYGFIAGMCAGNYDITDIFVDSTLIDAKVERTDVEVFYIPATQMAKDAGYPTLANMILLGHVIEKTEVIPEEMEAAMVEKPKEEDVKEEDHYDRKRSTMGI